MFQNIRHPKFHVNNTHVFLKYSQSRRHLVAVRVRDHVPHGGPNKWLYQTVFSRENDQNYGSYESQQEAHALACRILHQKSEKKYQSYSYRTVTIADYAMHLRQIAPSGVPRVMHQR